MSKDPKIDMPGLDNRGVSDPVLVNTNDGQVCVAWFDARDGYWYDEHGNTFGDVRRWESLVINYDLYGGECNG